MTMKRITLFLTAVVAAVLLISCERRQFIPDTGKTPVEFPGAVDSVDMMTQYIYVPIQMTEQSTVASKAIVEVVGGTVTMLDGSTRPLENFTNDQDGYENGGDIIVTSNVIYIPGFDPEEDDATALPSANIEIRIPSFRSFDEVKIELELVGEYLGDRTTTTVVASRYEGPVVVGTFNIKNPAMEADYDVKIEADATISNKYWFTNLLGDGTTRSLYGILDIDGATMTIDATQSLENTAYPDYSMMIVSGSGPADGDPVLVFGNDGFTFTNGLAIVDKEQNVYRFLINPGLKATLNEF